MEHVRADIRSDLCETSVFFPSLWQQRRYRVAQILEQFNITSVLDLGVGEGKLFQYLKHQNTIAILIGVDLDEEGLEIAAVVTHSFYLYD